MWLSHGRPGIHNLVLTWSHLWLSHGRPGIHNLVLTRSHLLLIPPSFSCIEVVHWILASTHLTNHHKMLTLQSCFSTLVSLSCDRVKLATQMVGTLCRAVLKVSFCMCDVVCCCMCAVYSYNTSQLLVSNVTFCMCVVVCEPCTVTTHLLYWNMSSCHSR